MNCTGAAPLELALLVSIARGPARFDRHVSRTLLWMAAGAILFGGCEDATTHAPTVPTRVPRVGLAPAGQSVDGPEQPLCDDGGVWRPLTHFRPAEPWDYVSLRSPHNELAWEELGEPCVGADAAACSAAVRMRSSDDALRGRRFLLATRGDEVRTFQGDSTREFFGELDTPEEAVWLIMARHPTLDRCSPRVTMEERRYGDGTSEIGVTLREAGPQCQYAPHRADLLYRVHMPGHDVPAGAEIGCPIP